MIQATIVLNELGLQETEPAGIILATADEPIKPNAMTFEYDLAGVRHVKNASADAGSTILGVPSRTCNSVAKNPFVCAANDIIPILVNPKNVNGTVSLFNPVVSADRGKQVYLSKDTPGEITITSPFGVQDEVSQPLGIVLGADYIAWHRGIPIKINV